MPKSFSFEKPRPGQKSELIEKIKEYPELDPRLTCNWPQNQERTRALEVIESGEVEPEAVIELSESKDFVVRGVGAGLISDIERFPEEKSRRAVQALEGIAHSKQEEGRSRVAAILAMNKFGVDSLPLFEKMIEGEDWEVQETVINAISEFGERALSLLEKTRGSKNAFIRIATARALSLIGEKGLHSLSQMFEDEMPIVKKRVVESVAGVAGQNTLPILEEMSKDEHPVVKMEVATCLVRFGIAALPILEAMSRDSENLVKRTVIDEIIVLGRDGLPLLNEIIKREGEDEGIKLAAIRAKQSIEHPEAEGQKEVKKGWPYLLFTKKPLFATPYTELLAERMLKLQDISQKLQQEFGNEFTGIVIFGSTSRGYLAEKSDLDWGIMAKNKIVSRRFRELASDLPLCKEHYIGVGAGGEILENQDILYKGLFFGDRKGLVELQVSTLENMSEKQWEQVRREIWRNEVIHLQKIAERFEIDVHELEKIKQAAALLRVPPPYEEAKKILARKAKKNK